MVKAPPANAFVDMVGALSPEKIVDIPFVGKIGAGFTNFEDALIAFLVNPEIKLPKGAVKPTAIPAPILGKNCKKSVIGKGSTSPVLFVALKDTLSQALFNNVNASKATAPKTK